MKKIITTVLALTLALGMSATAFGAPSPSTSGTVSGATAGAQSPSASGAVSSATGNNGAAVPVSSVVIDPASNDGKTIVAEAEAEAQKGIASYEEVHRIAQFDVECSAATPENPVTITFAIPAIAANDKIIVMHKTANGWVQEKNVEITANGTIKVTVTSCSPFVFYKVTGYGGWAGVDKVPISGSVSGSNSPSALGEVIGAVDKNGRVVDWTWDRIDSASDEGKTIVTEAEAKAQGGIASYEEIHRLAQFEVKCSAATPENPVTITFAIPAIAANDKIIVMHKTANGWVQEKNVEITANGTIKVTVTSCSPFVFYKVTGYDGWAGVTASTKAEMMNATQAGVASPKTGDAGVIGFMLIAATCGAGLIFGKKKLV